MCMWKWFCNSVYVPKELLSTTSTYLNPVWSWSNVCPQRAIINPPQPRVMLIQCMVPDYLEDAFLEDGYIKSLDIRQSFLLKVSENKVKQNLRRTYWSDSLHL